MMIDSLFIRNYRIFRELGINHLKRVNLFVGKNNSGKSCLLEALRIYTTNAAPSVLTEIVTNREENWNDTSEPVTAQEINRIDSPFRHLFHGYHFPGGDTGAIEIGPTGVKDKTIRVMPRLYEIAKDKAGRMVEIEMGLELIEGSEARFITHLFDLAANNKAKTTGINDKVQVVPPQGMHNETMEKLWDKINITDLEDEVIRCLQLIDPHVQKIAFVAGSPAPDGKKQRIPIVRYADSEERIPLKSLGDGMIRLFHIILSLVNVPGGYLLIDEFENGLHWSIQPGLWKIIFILAERLNIQVFVTTHSRDCIRGFYDVWSTREKDGTFYRLDIAADKKIKPVPYTCETLADSLDTGVEVR